MCGVDRSEGLCLGFFKVYKGAPARVRRENEGVSRDLATADPDRPQPAAVIAWNGDPPAARAVLL